MGDRNYEIDSWPEQTPVIPMRPAKHQKGTPTPTAGISSDESFVVELGGAPVYSPLRTSQQLGFEIARSPM
jgi:hypothetical protein